MSELYLLLSALKVFTKSSTMNGHCFYNKEKMENIFKIYQMCHWKTPDYKVIQGGRNSNDSNCMDSGREAMPG